MSFEISSRLEVLQVHESPLDIHVERYWQDLKGKMIKKKTNLFTGDH